MRGISAPTSSAQKHGIRPRNVFGTDSVAEAGPCGTCMLLCAKITDVPHLEPLRDAQQAVSKSHELGKRQQNAQGRKRDTPCSSKPMGRSVIFVQKTPPSHATTTVKHAPAYCRNYRPGAHPPDAGALRPSRHHSDRRCSALNRNGESPPALVLTVGNIFQQIAWLTP